MVASAVFITDLQGKSIISRNYRGDVPLTRAIERFAKYLQDTPDEQKKPIFQADTNSDFFVEEDVGCTGNDGETFVYVNVSSTMRWKYLVAGCVLRSSRPVCRSELFIFAL